MRCLRVEWPAMRVLLVVNTYATNYDENLRRVVEKALSADHKLEVTETNRHGHGLPITQGAVSDGVEAVVVWGGDGTVNEAANGLAGTSVSASYRADRRTSPLARWASPMTSRMPPLACSRGWRRAAHAVSGWERPAGGISRSLAAAASTPPSSKRSRPVRC
jgi:hypothetical protein